MEREAFVFFNFLIEECAATSTLATVAKDLSLSAGQSIGFQLLQLDRKSTSKV